MVTHFPLDYMHLVCLGVVRRILLLLIKGPRSTKLSASQITAISDELLGMRASFPREFSRKPRPLSELKQWKATEFREFLLYSGPVVLKGKLPTAVYHNFLRLSVAMRIFLSTSMIQHYVDYVENLLRTFVQTFSQVFGESLLVYNVHCLIHEDARRYGGLDYVSAFLFESCLGRLKKLVRRPKDPLQQIVRRLSECGRSRKHVDQLADRCRKPHESSSVPIGFESYMQYEQYIGESYFVSLIVGDNCFEIHGHIRVIKNILRSDFSQEVLVVFERFNKLEPFFSIPLSSDILSIFRVYDLCGTVEVYSVLDISKKCVLLPLDGGYAVFPQLHFM